MKKQHDSRAKILINEEKKKPQALLEVGDSHKQGAQLIGKLKVTKLKPKRKSEETNQNEAQNDKEDKEKHGNGQGHEANLEVAKGKNPKSHDEAKASEELLLQKRNYLEVEQSGTLHVPLAPHIQKETNEEKEEEEEQREAEEGLEIVDGIQNENDLKSEFHSEEFRSRSGSQYDIGSDSDVEVRKIGERIEERFHLNRSDGRQLNEARIPLSAQALSAQGGVKPQPTLMKKSNFSLDNMNLEDFYNPK